MTTATTLTPSSASTAATADQSGLTPNGEQAPINQSPQAEALVAWAKKQFTDIKSARVNLERQWYLNLSFVYGRQNVQFASAANSLNGYRLSVPPAPPWRVRLVLNFIRATIRKEIAKVVSEKPRFTVIPATTEDEDLAAARCGEQIFDSVYSKLKLQRIARRAEFWTTVCGTGFIKCYWDSSAEDLDSGSKGDFCVEPLDPFHVFVPDQRVEDVEHQPYVIHATTKDINWANAAYPQLKGHLQADTAAQQDLLADAFLNILGNQVAAKNQVLVLEVWIKPNGHPAFPKGGMFTVVGNYLVQQMNQFPYQHGMFPFIKLENVPAGKFYAESIVTDLIPIQRELNRSRSQMIEAKNLMGKPKLVAQEGSILPQKITSEPGQVILYKPGFQPPSPLPIEQLPQYVVEQVQMFRNDMDDISGQHDVSRGQNPSQVTSASALTFLQEQDDSMLSDTIESLEEGMEKLGKQILSLASQYWEDDRLVKVVGTDQAFEAMVFKKGSVGTDLRVESGSAMPVSKAAKQAFIMDLIKLGAIQVQDGLEALDMASINKIFDDYLVDIRQAQRENLKLSNGIPLLSEVDPGTEFYPNTWDNHVVHVAAHNKFRKQQTFEGLPSEVKERFEQHVQLHLQAMQQPQELQNPVDPNQTQLPPQQVGGVNPPPPQPQPPTGTPSPQGAQPNPSGGLPGVPVGPGLPTGMPPMIAGMGQ